MESSCPKEYKKIPYHIVFDVKFEVRRKSRLVADGSWCDPPKEDVFSGVVALDTVRLDFMFSDLNNFSLCVADVVTIFLYGKTMEKMYVTVGQGLGAKIPGKQMVIDKGLYTLRSSSVCFFSWTLIRKTTGDGLSPLENRNRFLVLRQGRSL